MGFPESSAGKESACNAADPGLILFLGFPGDAAGKESTCNARDLGWEDPLEKGTATYSSILAWRIP